MKKIFSVPKLENMVRPILIGMLVIHGFWVMITAVIIYLYFSLRKNEKDGRYTPIAFDITERKRADEVLNHALSAEKNASQRLYEKLKVANALLAKRSQELETRNRELETFTYSVSHDLKAPLRGIDGYSRLLLEDYSERLDEDGRFFIQTVRQSTLQMNKLIDDLLLYSRLERQELHTRAIIPRTIIQSILLERAEDLKAVRTDVKVEGLETAVFADADGLAMALRNLVDNAIKFTRADSQPMIEFGGHETETSCIIWVRDNGTGFDMKFHDRIFEIFQRLHRDEEYPGTGIGLAIVQKSIQRMDGRAWAESKPNQGATFYLEVPRAYDTQ